MLLDHAVPGRVSKRGPAGRKRSRCPGPLSWGGQGPERLRSPSVRLYRLGQSASPLPRPHRGGEPPPLTMQLRHARFSRWGGVRFVMGGRTARALRSAA